MFVLFFMKKKTKGDLSTKKIVENIMLKLDKNFNRLISQDEFIDGCLDSSKIRSFLHPSI